MPLSPRVYTFPELARKSFHGLPGMLADSLPDKFGNIVIRTWLSAQGRSEESFNPVERLCYTGKRGMGALEYIPARGPLMDGDASIQIDRLVQLASDILQAREDIHVPYNENAMRELIKVGSSAGGARAKAIIAWNEKTKDIRSGQVQAGEGYGYWIIKFDIENGNGDKEGEDGNQYTRIEYGYYLMAVSAGIVMNESRLFEENGRCHFMTRRFDRDPLTGAKIHMQSLGGLAHFDFNAPGAYSYEQVAEVMRKLRLTMPEITQFFRRMVFNVLGRNQDDHVKNVSFLMDRKGIWRLSPAYDMTYSYNPGGEWTETHQMRINGKQDNITRADLVASGSSMGIRKGEAERIIEEVAASVSRWSEFARKAKLRDDLAEKVRNAQVVLT